LGTTPHEADITSSNSPSTLLCGYVKKKKNELPSRGTGAELRFRIWRGQIEEKKIGVAKTIKIPKFRGKIIYIYIYILF
jgi:hypothetical protein